MTLSRRVLKRVNSPSKSPKLANSSLRKKALLKRLSNSVQLGSSSKANLKVVVRVRPENQREINNNARCVVDIVDANMLIFDPNHEKEDFFYQGTKQKFRDLNKKHHREQKFMFERIFDPSSTNDDIFETTTKDIVDTILNGYNCSVFAYGATGSGKTFTMIGNEGCPGITFLTVMELYKKIEEVEEVKTCEVGVSYLEVYNEMVRDLLVPGKPLNLHEVGQHVQVTGLSLHKPKNADELLKILAKGNCNRSQHPTDANAESSRSHAVFQVFIRQHDRSSDIKGNVSIAKLSMIDLAGSERGAATGFKGARFREGANINKSLLALGNCINALADGKGHIPYRDSKLTRLLKDSLGGNCRSVMIATITKSSTSFEDTFNTLRYANRAKTIKMTLKKNLLNVDQHVSQYLKMVEELKGELCSLKEQLKEYEAREEGKPPVAEGVGEPPLQQWVSNEEREMYEETISALKLQLEEKQCAQEKQSLSEKELLNRLTDLNCELKSHQREILQLETSGRELESKIYIQKVHLVRMNIFAFASKKLEKGISKSERSIQSYESQLNHIQNREAFLKGKLAHTKTSIVNLCDEFKKNLPDNSQEKTEEEQKGSTPDFLSNRLKQNAIEQNVRDSHQINAYLRSFSASLISNQATNEKLLVFLLIMVKDFYLKLRSVKECDHETEELLEKLLVMLDASRIEWADLKNTDESFREQTVSAHVSLEPILDAKKLTEFSLLLQSSFKSPPVNLKDADNIVFVKRSNMKSKPCSDLVSSSKTLAQNISECSVMEDGRETDQLVSPILSTHNLSANVTTPTSAKDTSGLQSFIDLQEISEEEIQTSKNESPDQGLHCRSDAEEINGDGSYCVDKSDSDVARPLEKEVCNLNLTSPVESSSLTNLRPNPPPSTTTETKTTPLNDCTPPHLNTTVTLDPNVTITIESPTENGPHSVVSKPPLSSLSLPTAVDSCNDVSPSDVFSPALPSPLETPLNDTFSVDGAADGNGRFCIPSAKPEVFTENPHRVLQTLPSSNNNSNKRDSFRPMFKRPSSSSCFSSSKVSFSNLPLTKAHTAVKKSFKKSMSTSSLHNGSASTSKLSSSSQYHGRGAPNSLKKSASFLRSRGGESGLPPNQENVPPKSVAFGSSFPAPPPPSPSVSHGGRTTTSKRALNFHFPNPPPDQ